MTYKIEFIEEFSAKTGLKGLKALEKLSSQQLSNEIKYLQLERLESPFRAGVAAFERLATPPLGLGRLHENKIPQTPKSRAWV
ncbi:hypothetical protein [Methylopila sp. M107]|uniref:hypothetical protein n=1 Tax=Methylopila sp. M107 TaxID=1101190 RepID=UPI0012DC588E|nr:hypothetical protein [Methylopila sp. M107]